LHFIRDIVIVLISNDSAGNFRIFDIIAVVVSFLRGKASR